MPLSALKLDIDLLLYEGDCQFGFKGDPYV